MLTKYYEPLLSTNLDPFFDSFLNLGTIRRSDAVDNDGIKIELPGVKAGEVDVNVEGRTLHVTGKTRHGKEFSYSYRLRNDVDVDSITARLSDGLLDIGIPRKESTTRTRKIQVAS
jgi:HSP20 family molecular chaperone IbpA